MSQTTPGSYDLVLMGNQPSTTLIGVVDRRVPGAESTDPPPRAKRKYTRRHQDKQRHEAHQDKEQSDG